MSADKDVYVIKRESIPGLYDTIATDFPHLFSMKDEIGKIKEILVGYPKDKSKFKGYIILMTHIYEDCSDFIIEFPLGMTKKHVDAYLKPLMDALNGVKLKNIH
jgi:hypothetical protein